MMDKPNNIDNEIQALEAYITSIDKGADEGLEQLGDQDNTSAFTRRLAILIDSKKYNDAVEAIKDREPEDPWCHLAIIASLANKNTEIADQLLAWANEHLKLTERDRCRVLYAKWIVSMLLGDEAFIPTITDVLDTDQVDLLRKSSAAVQSIVDVVVARQSIDTNLERIAVERQITNAIALAEHERSIELCKLLATRQPIPIAVGELALRYGYMASESLLQRLRTEHPDDFRAKWLACAIDGEILRNPGRAFDDANELIPLANTQVDREQLAGLMWDLTWNAGKEYAEKFNAIASSLLSDNPRMLSLYQAAKYAQSGDSEEANAILTEIRDQNDPIWLQISAQILLQHGDWNEAINQLRRAADLTKSPDILRRLAAIGYENDDISTSIESLEKVIRVDPLDIESKQMLARLYVDKEDYQNALPHLQSLYKLDSDNQTHALNLATCLAYLGEVQEALKLYEELCAVDHPPLQALVARSELLKAENKTDQAFELLHQHRDQFWDSSDYLQAYMIHAWSARKNEKGSEAFSQLLKLQQEGKAPPDLLESKSLDDLLEHAKAYNKWREELAINLANGKMPWLLADSMLNRAAREGWGYRTQSVGWVFDEPANRAELCIYSTNNFAVRCTEDKSKALVRLTCPQKGTPVVIDLSSLMTLHSLGMLDSVAAYFGKVLYPAVYLQDALHEKGKLILHQPSRLDELYDIKDHIDRGSITVIDDIGQVGQRPMPYVNEYSGEDNDPEHYYRLSDVIAVLHESGRLDGEHKQALETSASKQSGSDEQHPPLDPMAKVIVDLSTLFTLSYHGVLEDAARVLRIHVSQEQHEEIVGQIQAYAEREKMRIAYHEMWDQVRADNRYVPVTHEFDTDLETSHKQADRIDHSVAAGSLAENQGMPLMADDRVSQMMILNARPNDEYASFGSDCLLERLYEGKELNLDDLSVAFKQLIEWRYRFLTPHPDYLYSVALRHKAKLPGKELQSIASYMHDCIRDPGLFGGAEPTEPPMSMAMRLVNEWVSVGVNFLIPVWANGEFDKNHCHTLTSWVTSEMLPSIPKSMMHSAHVTGIVPVALFMARAMIVSHEIEDEDKANEALSSIQCGLGMTRKEYFRILGEVVSER